jgi:L-lactate dehydrogenase complex protein LldG
MPEINAREAILNRIRQANADTTPSEYAVIERNYQQTAGMDRAEIQKTFVERLHEYDAHVTEATGQTLSAAIAESLRRNNQRSAVLASGFPQQILPEGFLWHQESNTTTEQLNTAEGAICACDVAIAHTGTIIIRNARRATLLPDRLLCVVYEDQVVETVPEAFARLQPFASEPLTFISGPSATADIEMTRIRGVHGPRFLDVVLVRNSQ